MLDLGLQGHQFFGFAGLHRSPFQVANDALFLGPLQVELLDPLEGLLDLRVLDRFAVAEVLGDPFANDDVAVIVAVDKLAELQFSLPQGCGMRDIASGGDGGPGHSMSDLLKQSQCSHLVRILGYRN